MKRRGKVQQLFMLLLLLGLALVTSGLAGAQDEAPAAPPDQGVTDPGKPAEEPPTEIPPAEVPPTEAPPTETPPAEEVKPVEEATPEPTQTAVPLPPVFNLGTAPLTAVAGTPLAFQFTVADDEGVVRVIADTTGTAGAVALAATDPAETSAPFNTLVSVTYTAPEGFAGLDSFTLAAIDAGGLQAVAVVQVAVTPPLAPAPTASPTDIPTVERVINFNPEASEEAIQALLAEMGAVELERIPAIGAMRVLVPQALSQPEGAMRAMSASAAALAAGLTNIEPNIEYYGLEEGTIERVKPRPAETEASGLLTTNDPLLNQQYGLQNTGPGAWVRLAWDHSTKRGSGLIIAVVDSGVDLQHPDLIGQIQPGGWDFVNDDNNPDDDHGHGTHVAGIIAAKANNLQGIAGIAHNAKVLPVKVLNAANTGNTFNIAAGIVYAVDRGAKIINLSLGGPTPSTTTEGAIDYAVGRGVIVVAAAGNDGPGTTLYPAAFDNVISVGAHDSTGATASFSSTNSQVDISAAGVDIISTIPISGATVTDPSGYRLLSGTSMAAPHVSGIVGLIVSAGVATTPATVTEALICGARDLNSATLPGRDDAMGWGVVDADYSMKWRYNSPSCKVPQPNDDFERAAPITTVPFDIVQPIHSRSATRQASDPADCISPDQTLWYRFIPTVSGYYQVTTFGSSYDTVVAIYRGNTPGALTRIACQDDFRLGQFNNASFAAAQLVAGQTYYIMVDGFGSGWDDQVLNLSVRRTIETLNADIQDSAAANFACNGGWLAGSLASASGGTFRRTTDNNATAAFSVMGNRLQFARVAGPDKGDTEVWINGIQFDFDFISGNNRTTNLSNRSALITGNAAITVPLPLTGLNRVVVRRAQNSYLDTSGAVPPANGPQTPGEITLDRVRVSNTAAGTNVVMAIADDPDLTRYYYEGAWAPVITPGSHLNTARRTTVAGSFVSFRARGSTVTIYRNVAPGYGDATVTVDGAFYGTMVNNTTTGLKVPYVITGLSPSEHVIIITNNAGGTLEFDAAMASSPAPVAAKVNENAPAISYGGVWVNLASPGFFGGTTRASSDPDARVEFMFTGTHLCLGYLMQPGGGAFLVSIDGSIIDTINTNNVTRIGAQWCSHTSSTAVGTGRMFFNGQHQAVIRRFGAGVLELDYFQPGVYNLLTPARGLVQENDAAISYAGTWTTATGALVGPIVSPGLPGAKSQGGFLPQGGAMRRSNQDGATATFFINGTGFILYSSVGPAQGCVQVLVNGAVQPILVNGVSRNALDLYLSTSPARYRPMAYGFTDLPRGIHKVQLVVDSDCSVLGYGFSPIFYTDIDGIRVFP